jgi:hypothetical protein
MKIARLPPPCFRQHQETRQRLVELSGLLDIKDIADLGEHREAGRRDGPLQKQTRLDAGIVLVAGDDGRQGIRRYQVFGVEQTSKRRPITSGLDPSRTLCRGALRPTTVDKRAKWGAHLPDLNNRRNGPPRPIVFTSRCCEANGR